jgi:hypothetical protein
LACYGWLVTVEDAVALHEILGTNASLAYCLAQIDFDLAILRISKEVRASITGG